ncbi:MAG TPA: GTPase, partial [Fibrella sp.]
DYPFTTLVPNLGVVAYRDYKSFVIADIPGIIEGASQGKGLGLRFLRHIERNSVLLFLIPATSDDIAAEYQILANELVAFNPELADKTRVLAITKIDLVDEEVLNQIRNNPPVDVPTVVISSVQQAGLTELKDLLWKTLTTPAEQT